MRVKSTKTPPEFVQPTQTFPFFNETTITSRLYRVPRLTQNFCVGVFFLRKLRYTWKKPRPVVSWGMKIVMFTRKESPSGKALALASRGDMVKVTGYLAPDRFKWRGATLTTWKMYVGRVEVLGQVAMVRRNRKVEKLERERQEEMLRVREIERKRKKVPEAEDIADDILDSLDLEI